MAETKKATKKITSKETKDGTDKKDSKLTSKTDSKKEAVAEQLIEVETAKQKDAPLAKAGRRSAKAIAEEEAKKAKEERKAQTESTDKEPQPKAPAKPVRSRVERRSKNYRKSADLIDKSKQYSLAEALELAKKTSTVKFDASVELHVRLNVDPKQADQNIRDNVVLPAGTGKTLRIAVFADPENVAKAKKAGADIAASDEFLQQLDKGEVNFDTLIATPPMMTKLGKYARLLGPKGLMPNPKSGTVTTDVAKAVTEAKAGRVEYRVDSTGIVHVAFGKVSFDTAKLTQNCEALLASIRAAKPTSIKSAYIRSMFIATSMGPSIPLKTNEIA